jgi:hypothetical protein
VTAVATALRPKLFDNVQTLRRRVSRDVSSFAVSISDNVCPFSDAALSAFETRCNFSARFFARATNAGYRTLVQRYRCAGCGGSEIPKIIFEFTEQKQRINDL